MADDAMALSRRPLLLLLIGALLLIGGLAAAAFVQSPRGVTVNEVYFEGASGARMRGLLFRPAEATAERPAPAILAVHGYLNSAEMQSNFAIEYARRGYVVLAPDQRGHGGSDPTSFADGFGGPDALAYLRSLPFVDRDNIGLEGHSMGGWTVLAAAKAYPDGYRAMVLEGSSVGAPFAPEGDVRFPRNLLVVFGLYDEFGGFMWGPESPTRTGATAKAKVLFGIAGPVVPGRLYGDPDAGTARMLETPAVTHPWLHESRAGITPALLWFERTLEGERRVPVADQVWPLKELAGALALIGIVPFCLGLFWLLLRTPAFAALKREDGPDDSSALGGRGYATLAAMGLIPMLSYLPVMMAAEFLVPPNALLRQTFTNQLAVWAVLNALLSLAATWFFGTRAPAKLVQPVRSLALALAVAAGLAIVIVAADRLGHVSPQWWIVIWRPLTLERLQDFLVYLPAFVLFAVATLRALDGLVPLGGAGRASALAAAMGVLVAPFALFLAVQYGVLAATGALLTPTEGLRVIIAILFIPLLLLVALIGLGTTRTTRSVLPGALLCGILLTWFVTATQPIAA
jgi:pimeloyl-ACP methyl ester carboxylesterase